MNSVDITEFLGLVISFIYDVIGYCWSVLDSIKFSGTSLLEYIITLTILSVIIPIIFARLKSSPNANSRSERRHTEE